MMMMMVMTKTVETDKKERRKKTQAAIGVVVSWCIHIACDRSIEISEKNKLIVRKSKEKSQSFECAGAFVYTYFNKPNYRADAHRKNYCVERFQLMLSTNSANEISYYFYFI